MRGKFLKAFISAALVAAVGFSFISIGRNRGKLDYGKNLGETAVTVDGREISFGDLAFYILYEERVVEEQAMVYNPESTKDYWNIHTNGGFFQDQVKESVMGMAVHDYIFYDLAVAQGMDTLTPEEKEDLEFATLDFWEDLLDEQWDRLPADEETINSQIRIAAIAEKYQNYLADSKGPSKAAYNYDGYYYEQMKSDHDIVINEKLWDRFVMGDNTLEHSKVNYINGYNKDDKSEKEK
ncbi:MAG: hypothetical protein K5773_07700 [Pseudobutyrivibrio sp.]|nr:hypothetical protein [Pseudobutyrivibrio sp.]